MDDIVNITVNKICKPNMYTFFAICEKMTCILYENDVMGRGWVTQVYMWITLWKWWIMSDKLTENMTFLEFIDKNLYLQFCLQNDFISQRHYVNYNFFEIQ